MSEYFKNSEERQYIPPDYDCPPEGDDSDSDIGEIDSDITDQDEGKEETIIDEIHKEEDRKEMVTTPFGTKPPTAPTTPWNPPSFGGGQSSPFGTGGGSSIWGGTSRPSWGTGVNQSTWGQPAAEKKEINRKKKVIFCDFLDCIVETLESQGAPGFLPRDIYDLKPRFEVWGKIQAFNPEVVYSMIPINLIPNTNGAAGWIKTLEYFCCCLSSYLRVPYESCKILAQTAIGQPKEELINSILVGPDRINKDDAIYIGIYSGLAGQSNRDQLAAANCGIDYVDLGILLNNMY